MALRNTNAYDMIENSRLKIDSKTRTKEKKVKEIIFIKYLIDLINNI